jgi:hypothetical protein
MICIRPVPTLLTAFVAVGLGFGHGASGCYRRSVGEVASCVWFGWFSWQLRLHVARQKIRGGKVVKVFCQLPPSLYSLAAAAPYIFKFSNSYVVINVYGIIYDSSFLNMSSIR